MEEQQKISRRILLLTTLAMVFSFTVWASLSPLANQFETIYGLTATQTSVLVAIPVLLGSVMRVPLGILTDQHGGRKVFTALLIFTIIPLIGIGFADSYYSLLIWAFFLGMSGACFAVSITFVAKWTPTEKQGTALGINGMGNIGTALAGAALPTIAVVYGVQWAFWILVVPIVIMAVMIWCWTPETPKPAEKKTLAGTLSVLKHKDSIIFSLFYFVTFGAFVAFGIYLPTLLMSLHDLSAVDAGARAAGFVILATLVRPFGGYAGDKIGAGKAITVVFIGITLGGLVLTFGLENMALMTAACLLIALMCGIGNGAIFKLVPEKFPKSTGAVTGIVGAAGGLGGFFPPILLGMVQDVTGTYMLGFLLLSILALVCFVINLKQYDNTKYTRLVDVKAGS
ncbi:nitrate/nitrite transporter [Thalassorhabdus alkalitolerans]|uniref:Nitrate/nitrite transporter n=1 Tax=Thalassorhabdus alkalitolerans TaxID=2282697 RepID=A0ABW0YRC5_9BACI